MIEVENLVKKFREDLETLNKADNAAQTEKE